TPERTSNIPGKQFARCGTIKPNKVIPLQWSKDDLHIADLILCAVVAENIKCDGGSDRFCGANWYIVCFQFLLIEETKFVCTLQVGDRVSISSDIGDEGTVYSKAIVYELRNVCGGQQFS